MGIKVRFIRATIEIDARPCPQPGCHETHERTIYRTVDGVELDALAIGDVWIDPWAKRQQEQTGKHTCPWTNCDGTHAFCAVPPDGHPWQIDGRCSNCTRKDDTTHRCWVRHGDPETGTLHVDKNGDTCSAGAGSIAAPGWHGYLHHGELVVA